MFSFLLFLSSAFAENDPQKSQQSLDFGYRINLIPMFKSNPDFNAETSQDNLLTIKQGVQFNIHGKWDGLQIKSSFQDVRLWGTESSPVFTRDSYVALHEGYAQIDGQNSWLRLGRQEYVLNDGLILSAKPWSVNRIAFNGARFQQRGERLLLEGGVFTLKNFAYYASTCTDDPATAENECETFAPEYTNSLGDYFVVLNSEINVNPKLQIKPYLLILRQGAIETDQTRDRTVYSPFLRVQTKTENGVNFNIDAAYQFGQAAEGISHSAWMAKAFLQYKFDIYQASLVYDERSGDGDASDDTVGDFEGFFGMGHRYRGIGDFVGFSNIRDISAAFRASPNRKLNISVQYHYFQLSNPQGNWYLINGTTRGTANPDNDDANLGQEIDLSFTIRPRKGMRFQFTHATFMPMGVGQEKGGDDISSATYMWMVVEK